MAAQWLDLVDQYMAHTAGLPTPERFRLWAGIALVGGCLERRVWLETAGSPVYPNLYTLLIAAPGIGKSQALSPLRDLWENTKAGSRHIHVAPNSVTKAALLDEIAGSRAELISPDGTQCLIFHSVAVASSEFGVLVPAHDLEFLNVLNDVFDNPSSFKEKRRVSKSVDITAPGLNLIAGTQPGYLANLLPEEAWTMGFMSRIIMVYASSTPQVDLFDVVERPPVAGMQEQLNSLLALYGCGSWTDDAKAEFITWYKGGMKPVPEHSKLANYNSRRVLHALKLCLISAVSRTGKIQIDVPDVLRALAWLHEAERVMPDVFREMVQRSDAQVIADLHFFMWRDWLVHKKPIPIVKIIHFLQAQVPSDKIDRIIETAVRANIIQRVPGENNMFIPRAKHDHGIE